MGEIITYYYPDGRVEASSGKPPGRGSVWVDGEYRPPTYPSALSLRVGEAGVRIAAIVRDYKAANGDIDAVVRAWAPYLTADDVHAAIRFYRANEPEREEIDHKLAEDSALV